MFVEVLRVGFGRLLILVTGKGGLKGRNGGRETGGQSYWLRLKVNHLSQLYLFLVNPSRFSVINLDLRWLHSTCDTPCTLPGEFPLQLTPCLLSPSSLIISKDQNETSSHVNDDPNQTQTHQALLLLSHFLLNCLLLFQFPL